jgi:hypothetical protein
MARFSSPLDNLRVAAPCSSDWNQMAGDERVRFCRQCSLNVYNLSSMTRSEAEKLIANTEGRLCVRYYRRGDGTVLTKNCPVGLRAIKRRVSRTASAMLSAVLGFFAGLGIYTGTVHEEPQVYSNSMGQVALPKDNAVKVNKEESPELILGSYSYEEGRAELPARASYRTKQRVTQGTRR